MDSKTRVSVILTAKNPNELKTKIKRYYMSYDEELYETVIENTYEENNIFKALISRMK